MVTQNLMRTQRMEENSSFVIALDLIKCFKQIISQRMLLACVPISNFFFNIKLQSIKQSYFCLKGLDLLYLECKNSNKRNIFLSKNSIVRKMLWDIFLFSVFFLIFSRMYQYQYTFLNLYPPTLTDNVCTCLIIVSYFR